MDEMEQKLGQILGNPQMMGKIMELASSLDGNSPQPAGVPDGMQALGGLLNAGAIDANQQALLKALTPYVSPDRVSRLEKAMRAAKMARLASSFLGGQGLQMLTGG